MAIKFDKEMLLKHRFWILVGVTSLLTMTGIVYLEIYGSEDTEAIKKKLKTELDKVRKEKGDKGQLTVDAMAASAKIAKDNEAKVWSEAYAQQEKYFTWAKPVEDEFGFLNGKFARDIKITKKVDKLKDLPPDDPANNLIHGVLGEAFESYLTIKTRDGKEVKIHAMAKSNITAPDGKPRQWGQIAKTTDGAHPTLAITYQNGMYFNDPLTGPEKTVFKSAYVKQIHDILRSVDPLDDKGNGVVQLKNWLYNKDEEFDANWNNRFIRVVNKPWELGKGEISTEAWIAQEDLWIQKEIYRIIRSANDDISLFKWDGGDAKKSPEDLKGPVAEKRDTVYRFKNSSFALELVLQKNNELSFTIKNLLPRKQKLDLNFRVILNSEEGRKPEIIRISDVPLNPAGDDKKKDTLTRIIPVAKDVKDAAPRKGIYGVEQILTWETAAIKRIDQVSIGSNGTDDIGHSHRTFPDDLRAFVLDDQAAEVKDPAVPAPKIPPGRKPPFGPPGVFVPGAGGAGNKTMLPHGLWTDRYVEVTEQSRRVPVAVALIVDQDHVLRVLTAFNNSKLRFLETQVLLNLYPSSLQPPMVVEKKEGFQPGANPRFPGPGPGNPFGPGGANRQPVGAGAGASDSDSNMEMVIYGIMTLYQRYPPRPAVTDKKQ